MKLKKIYAAILAAVLCMGTVSATAFADGNNMMLQPVTSEEDTDNGGADNETSDPDDEKPVLPLSPVTGDGENGDPSAENKTPADEETPIDGSETGNDDKDNDPSDENKAPADEETPSDSSGTGDDDKENDQSEENKTSADGETPASGSETDDNDKDNTLSAEIQAPAEQETHADGSGTNNSDTDRSETNSAPENTAPTNGSAAIRLGETVSVKSEALGGEVTVAADKDDTALEGAAFELSALDKTKAADKLNKVVDAEFGDAVKAAVTAVENGNAVALDIGFTKNGSAVQPTKDVTVTAPVPEDLKGAEKLFVYHVTNKGLDDVTSKCTYDKENGSIAITNSVFSPYIISKTEIKVQTAAYDELKAYDDNFSTGVVLAVAPIVVAGAFLAVVSLKKRR